MAEQSSDILGFIYKVAMKLIDLGTASYNFLFSELDIAGVKFSFWELLGGIGLAAILILVIVKAITPLL